MCYPWYMPKPKGLQIPLCTFYGNECITKKIANTTHMLASCDCVPSCSGISYKYVVDSIRKFTTEDVATLCGNIRPHLQYVYNEEKETANITQMVNVSKKLGDHADEQCHDYVSKGYARVTVKMAGSSYLRRSQSIAMSFTDKLGVIGGTVGIFSGFSFVALFEFLHWVVVTLFKFYKSSVEPEEEDPLEKLERKMKKENEALKIRLAKCEEIMMKKDQKTPLEKPSEAEVVIDIE